MVFFFGVPTGSVSLIIKLALKQWLEMAEFVGSKDIVGVIED